MTFFLFEFCIVVWLVGRLFLIRGPWSLTPFNYCNYQSLSQESPCCGIGRTGFGVLLTNSLVHLDASINFGKEGKERFSKKTRHLSAIRRGKHSLGFLSLLDHYNPVPSRGITLHRGLGLHQDTISCAQLSQSVPRFCTKEPGVESRHHMTAIMNRSWLEIEGRVYARSTRNFGNSQRHNSISLVKWSCAIEERATCSLIFPLWPSSCWNLGTL